MNSNINWVNSPSCGVTLKKYLNPLVVNLGDVDSPFTQGIPALSETWLAAPVTEE